ncbi:MAG TPA: hypothetical protein VJB34_10415 [Bdellovibrionota bacterium]|nr:hypothetical protein [Bdellovibrionota bacterium]
MRRRLSVLLSLLFLLNSLLHCTAQENRSESTSQNARLVSELRRLQWSYSLLDTIEGIDVSRVLKREVDFCLGNHTFPEGDLFNQLLFVSQASRLTIEQTRTFLKTIETFLRPFLKEPADKTVSNDLLIILREAHYEIQHRRVEKSCSYLESVRMLKNTGLLMQKASEIEKDFYHVRECLALPGEAPVNHNMDEAALDAIHMFLYTTATNSDLEQKLIGTHLLMIRYLLDVLESTPRFMAHYSLLYRDLLELIERFHDEIKYQYSVKERARVAGFRETRIRDSKPETPPDMLMERINFVANGDGTLSLVVPEETVGDRLVLGIRRAWNRYMPVSRRASERREAGEKDSWLRKVRRYRMIF